MKSRLAIWQIEDAAAELLKRHQVGDVIPVPVDYLAEATGATVVRHRFEGDQSGFVYRDGARIIIGVNSATSRRRQRFTIGHELGHMHLHQSDNPLLVDQAVQVHRRDHRSSLAVDPLEIEANAFAAAVLMPSDQVLQHVNDARELPRERLVLRLAQTFDVSTEAMSYRLINLGVLST